MVILRRTEKLKSTLPVTELLPHNSETALGDWYVNRIVIDRRPLLLLISSISYLPLLLPARDIRSLPDRLGALVEVRLERCGIDTDLVAAELRAMNPVVIGPTVSRSVLGIMVDFAKGVRSLMERAHSANTDFREIEDGLAETPCHAGRAFSAVVFPNDKTLELLRAKWLRRTETSL